MLEDPTDVELSMHFAEQDKQRQLQPQQSKSSSALSKAYKDYKLKPETTVYGAFNYFKKAGFVVGYTLPVSRKIQSLIQIEPHLRKEHSSPLWEKVKTAHSEATCAFYCKATQEVVYVDDSLVACITTFEKIGYTPTINH